MKIVIKQINKTEKRWGKYFLFKQSELLQKSDGRSHFKEFR